MSDIVGVVEVLVRPIVKGFTGEATPQIVESGKDLGRELSKAILAGFAIGGVAEGIKSVVEAATAQNNAFIVLDKTLENAGLSVKGFSSSLHDNLEVQARATGVSAEKLAAAMARIVPATGSVKASVKDLNTAIGISETYHIDLSTAALALAKAETGSYTSLQRYLGLVPRATANVDALKARYTALIEAGGKLDATQKAQYASALKVAQTQDDQITSQQALASAQAKFAGVAGANAQSYEGQFERLHVALDQLKVAAGTELVSGLASASGGLADYIGKLIESEKVQEQAKQAADDVKSAISGIKKIVETIGPPLLTLADDFGGVTKSLEGLAAAGLVSKIVGGLTAVTTAETVAGDAAVVNARKIDGLKASLGRLALLGAITIPIEILLNKKSIDKDVTSFLKDNGLGFATGKQYTDLKQLEADAAKNGGLAGDLLTKIQDESQGTGPQAKALKKALDASQKGAAATSIFKPFIDRVKEAAKQSKFSLPEVISGSFNLVDPKAKAALATAGADAVKALSDGITADKTDLQTIKDNLADTIKQGAQAVIDAVNQAKQNLNSIGSSLSAEIQSILVKPITDAQQQITNAQDKLSLATSKTTLRNLGESVYLPGGKRLSSDPTQALAQLKELEKKTGSVALRDFITQYQSSVLSERSAGLTVANDALTATGNRAQTRISGLTDLFNTGKLTKAGFSSRISGLLKNLGITPAAAGQALGVSGADTLRGLEQGLLQQASAIKNGPQRAGSGLVPSITRPLQTLESTTKEVSSLRAQEAAKELDESKKQTQLLKKLAAQKAADKFTSSLSQNPGKKSKKTAALVGTGG